MTIRKSAAPRPSSPAIVGSAAETIVPSTIARNIGSMIDGNREKKRFIQVLEGSAVAEKGGTMRTWTAELRPDGREAGQDSML